MRSVTPESNSPAPNSEAGQAADLLGWRPPSLETLQRQLHGYAVTTFLARGGMGAVYRGEQISLGRQVAIKILPPQLRSLDPMYAQRFTQEARAMGRLNHPCIVSVYDFGEMADGTLYFIMEYIDGTDVAQMVSTQRRLTSLHAISITAHVCDALDYAHQNGVVHRDIKPANVMVGYDGRVKVADFGLAKSKQHANSSLTISGHVMGTPHFVAPEALTLGVEVDHRADIYAVGVMLYQMLTGKLPQGLFEMPSKLVNGLDPRYDEIVASAMRDDRERRYQHVTDLRRALNAILTKPIAHVSAAVSHAHAVPPTITKPQNVPTPGRSAKKAASFVLVYALLTVIAVAVFFVLKLNEPALIAKKAEEAKTEPKMDNKLEPSKGVSELNPPMNSQQELPVKGSSAVEKSTAPGTAKGIMARYVRIEAAKGMVINLAEVEVISDGKNIAAKGKATQSGMEHGGNPEHAIDGHTGGDESKGDKIAIPTARVPIPFGHSNSKKSSPSRPSSFGTARMSSGRAA
jgi:serine/threonine protein kinase